MKKLLNFAAGYAVLGLALGVFYREFTKLNGFLGTTALGFLHVHTLVLGMFLFLILVLFENAFALSKAKAFPRFMLFYNIGLFTTITMLCVRGVTQVLRLTLSTGVNAGISGLAGVGHIILAIGLYFLFKSLYQRIQKKEQ